MGAAERHPQPESGMSRRLKWLIAIAVVLAFAAGGAAAWAHARESRASSLAVKYGLAPSKGEATQVDRCTAVMLEDYESAGEAEKAGLGADAFGVLAPRVCSLGVSRGLVSSDGTMSDESSFGLTMDVMNQMGPARIQTLIFNELAVTYGLAQPGKATRWHRCVAMAYSGYDAQPTDTNLPPEARWQQAARSACKEGIERGIVSASGAPEVGSAEAGQLFALICSEARRRGSC
jgi:hypothetical protein